MESQVINNRILRILIKMDIIYLLTGEGEGNDSLAVYIETHLGEVSVYDYILIYFVRLLEVCKRIAIKCL